jgi:hypothetical protein
MQYILDQDEIDRWASPKELDNYRRVIDILRKMIITGCVHFSPKEPNRRVYTSCKNCPLDKIEQDLGHGEIVDLSMLACPRPRQYVRA